MKVSDCKGCTMVRRHVWSQRHEPLGYHAIGFNHAYHYCLLLKKRCLEVKKCECKSKLLHGTVASNGGLICANASVKTQK